MTKGGNKHMRNIIVVLLVVSIAAVAYCQKMNLNVWGGYATVSMADVNKQLDLIADSLEADGASTSVSKLGSGLVFGVDAGYELSEGISLGPRVAYISCSQGNVTGETSSMGYNFTSKFTVDASLIPIMIGGSYTKEIAENLLLSGKLYLGYGLASVKVGVKIESNVPDFTPTGYSIPYEGSGLVIDLCAAGEYKLAKNISLGLNLGYRMAKISEMKATKDVPEMDIKKGDVPKDAEDKAIPFDYSGVTAGLGINFKF